MSRTTSIARTVGLIGLVLAAGSLAAGCASDWSHRPRPDRTNVVQRPIYEADGTKALYLGGYAGANYDYGPRPAR